MRKRVFFRVLAVGGAFAVTVLAADLALRPLLRQRLYVRPHKMFVNAWPTNEALRRYAPNASFAGKTHGDLAVMHGDPQYRVERFVRFTTDELGFRNRLGQARENNRLVLLGDSLGVGSSGSQEHMVADVLRETYQIENYNLSVGGFSPWHEFMTLKYELPRISLSSDAAVLWLLFSGNDLDAGKGADFELRRNGLAQRLAVRLSTAYERSPIRLLLRPKVDLRSRVLVNNLGGRPILFYMPYIGRAQRTEEEVRSHRNYRSLEFVFEKMADFCSSRGLRLHVVLIPTKAETYSWVGADAAESRLPEEAFGLSVVLRQWSEELEIPFLDLYPHFEQAARERFLADQGLLYWRDDTHWNNEGQSLAAQVIVSFLREAGDRAESDDPQESTPTNNKPVREVHGG